MILTGFLLVQYFKTVNKTPIVEKTLSTSTDQAATVSASPSLVAMVTGSVKPTTKPTAKPTKSVPTPTPTSVKISPVPTKTIATPTPVQNIKAGSEYTIQPGDSLWNISVKTYGDGYEWTKIYEVNKLALGNNPSLINSGTKINLPQMETAKTVEYTVKKGDNLWNISASICGSGFVWTQIAADNQIGQPSLIFAGTVLKVTCPRK